MRALRGFTQSERGRVRGVGHDSTWSSLPSFPRSKNRQTVPNPFIRSTAVSSKTSSILFLVALLAKKDQTILSVQPILRDLPKAINVCSIFATMQRNFSRVMPIKGNASRAQQWHQPWLAVCTASLLTMKIRLRDSNESVYLRRGFFYSLSVIGSREREWRIGHNRSREWNRWSIES